MYTRPDLNQARCANCHQVRPLDQFCKDKRKINGRQSWCKLCEAARKKGQRARKKLKKKQETGT